MTVGCKKIDILRKHVTETVEIVKEGNVATMYKDNMIKLYKSLKCIDF